jgi:hypothetical protein
MGLLKFGGGRTLQRAFGDPNETSRDLRPDRRSTRKEVGAHCDFQGNLHKSIVIHLSNISDVDPVHRELRVLDTIDAGGTTTSGNARFNALTGRNQEAADEAAGGTAQQ